MYMVKVNLKYVHVGEGTYIFEWKIKITRRTHHSFGVFYYKWMNIIILEPTPWQV